MRIDGWCRWMPGIVVVLVLAGCAGSATSTAGTSVPVTEIATVAGKWTGLMDKEGSRDREDFVEVAIDSSGTYQAFTARTIGVMNAQGKVVVSDGKLLFKGDRGAEATATLYTQPTSPQRTLRLEGSMPSGRRFSARLQQQP